MAENKKTFIFYSDWINMVREMPSSDAGDLLKHILSYVNDESPTTKNILVRMAFGHMKPMIKSDLIKWDGIRKQRAEYGKKGGQAKAKHKLSKPKQLEAVNVNENVNVNGNENKENKEVGVFEKVYFEKSTELDSAFKDYLKLRKLHKFTMTERAINTLVNKLRKISNGQTKVAIEIIDNAIVGKWKSFYPNKD